MRNSSLKCVFFATGIPDPTQGGSGIVNYLFCKSLIDKKISTKAFFLASKKFRKSYQNNTFLKELITLGIKIEFIDVEERNLYSFGFKHLSNLLNYNSCQSIIEKNKNEILDADLCFSTGLGWALSLAKLNTTKFSFNLQDDILQMYYYDLKSSILF